MIQQIDRRVIIHSVVTDVWILGLKTTNKLYLLLSHWGQTLTFGATD